VSEPQQSNSSQVADPVASEPSFLGALCGIWLLTWRSQLTWRKVPTLVLSLLSLPVVVYITTSSSLGWSQSHSLLGSPLQRFEELSRRLARGGVPLKPEQGPELRRVFQEEFAKAETELAEGQPDENLGTRRAEQVKNAYQHIRERARKILDDRQFSRYEYFETRILEENERRSGELFWSRSGAYYHWLIDFYFFVMLPLNCVRACGALIRDELQTDTLGFLTTRPLSRARLLLAKYLSQTVWLQVFLLLETALLFSTGWLRQIPAVAGLLPLFLFAQFLSVFAWSALGTLLGLLTNRYMGFAIVYGLIVEMGIGRIPTNINTLSLMRHLKVLLANNATLQGIYDWSSKGVPLAVGALLFATALFLTISAIVFTVREYHHTSEMQK
jgi:hypothetical protein